MYPEELKEFPGLLTNALSSSYAIMDPDVRSAIVHGLIFLTNRSIVDQISCLKLLFSIISCKDKQMRAMIFNFALSTIKAANKKSKNVKLNKAAQNMLLDQIVSKNRSSRDKKSESNTADENYDAGVKLCVDLCIQLYKKDVWNDSKCVQIIAEGCFSDSNSVMATALHFFTSESSNEVNNSDDEEDSPYDLTKLKFRNNVTKKTKAKKSSMQRIMKTIKKKENRAENAPGRKLSPVHFVLDPQGLAEKLNARLCGSDRKMTKEGSAVIIKDLPFSIRLLLMNFISRLVGAHKLILPNFYNYIVRYMRPHQESIVIILAIAAQSCHDLAPSDGLELLIKTLVEFFVSETYSAEVITAGLNTIREICVRSTLGMDAETLSYLVDFKSHRDKGVMASARSLIGLFREVDPELLPKKERGKEASMQLASERKGIASNETVDAEVSDIEEDSGEDLEIISEAELDEEEMEEISEMEENPETVSENSDMKIDVLKANKFLTDEDFMNMAQTNGSDAGEESEENEDSVFVKQEQIERSIKRAKQTKEERIASVMEGRKDRPKFGSKKGGERGSTTNKEKAKNKNFLMMIHKRSVKAKKKMSLRSKQRKLREHIDRQKKQY